MISHEMTEAERAALQEAGLTVEQIEAFRQAAEDLKGIEFLPFDPTQVKP